MFSNWNTGPKFFLQQDSPHKPATAIWGEKNTKTTNEKNEPKNATDKQNLNVYAETMFEVLHHSVNVFPEKNPHLAPFSLGLQMMNLF